MKSSADSGLADAEELGDSEAVGDCDGGPNLGSASSPQPASRVAQSAATTNGRQTFIPYLPSEHWSNELIENKFRATVGSASLWTTLTRRFCIRRTTRRKRHNVAAPSSPGVTVVRLSRSPETFRSLVAASILCALVTSLNGCGLADPSA